MKGQIGISVVVCCYNSAKLIEETIIHLGKQQTENISWEIILVDNASTDETADLSKQFLNKYCSEVSHQVVYEPKPGLSNARACGMGHAKYEFVLFVDDDNRLSSDYVQEAYQTMDSHSNIALMGGKGELDFEKTPPSWFSDYHSSFALGSQARNGEDELQNVDQVYGAGIVIRESVYQYLHELGFPELLTGRKGGETISGEDNELSLALRMMGAEVWYNPNLQFKHYMTEGRLNWKYLQELFYGFGRAKAYLDIYRYFLKNDELPKSKSRHPFWKDRLSYLKSEYTKRKAKFKIQNLVKSTEGNKEQLMLEGMKGQIFELERLGKQVEELYREVQTFKNRAKNYQHQ